MGMYTTDITVRYAETDRMGVAHHSSHLLWFELARPGQRVTYVLTGTTGRVGYPRVSPKR